MSDERARSDANLPPKTRAAIQGLQDVLRAAATLSRTPAPSGRGAGQELIDREIGDLRARIGQLCAGTDSLDEQLRSPYRMLVVGPSQVGKSTLINVIAGHRILPTVGVGDAKTLKETVLTYSAEGERTLRVRYITKQDAQQRRFTLETYARKLPELKAAFVKPWNTKEQAAAGVPDDAPDLSTEAASEETNTARREVERRFATLVMQIQTLTYPEVRDPARRADLPQVDKSCLESATIADWVDGWCILLGHDPVAGERFSALWRPRLAPIAELLGRSIEVRESVVGATEFRDIVERHTAEGLAFLVDRVELALPAEDLEQMDVEDLPGVGNYQDAAADVARDVLTKAMRERDLDGLLVVTAQNGLDQNTANLVEEASVLRRVLLGQTDLAIAITHIDQIGRQWAQDMEDQGMGDGEFPSNNEILHVASEQAAAPQIQRLTELLRRHAADVDEPERTSRVEAVLDRTKVVGVEASAAEAYRFKLRQKIAGAFATSYEGTGVHELIAHFKERAKSRHTERMERVLVQTERIRDSIAADLNRIARDHDVEEAVKLQTAARSAYLLALKDAQLPLSNTWIAIKQRSSSRLEDRVPAQLPMTQMKAQKEGMGRKRAVIARCERAGPYGGMIHWATMEAALRWGGTWTGAHHIDLPGDLADALMPALILGWRQISAEIEALLSDYRKAADALLTSLDLAAQGAARLSGLKPNDAAIADARTQLRNNVEAAITNLNAHMDQLTERVQPALRAVLKGHFEAECERVLREIPRGSGFTRRALKRYDEIGESAIERGAETGVLVLRKSFEGLRRQLQSSLIDQDPVEFAFRRLIATIHDAAESPEVVAARAALVAWARANRSWAEASTGA